MKTISHLCLGAVFAVLSLFPLSADIMAQTRGPSPIYDAQTTGQRAAYDRVSSPRPGFVIGWNWGASLLGVNTDLQTNFQHLENPWRYGDPSPARPHFSLNNLPPRTSLVIAPSDEVPATDFPTLYEWYQRARNLDNTPPNSKGNEPLDVGKGSVNGLSEGLGLRFHPELDLSDTTQFEPVHGTRQRAGFGFRERLRGTTTSDTTGGADLRWHLSADSVSGWEQVLGQSWPQQEFVRWTRGDGIEQWAPFTGKRMVVGIHLRRTDTTDVAMNNDTVLRLRVMTQRMDTPTHTVAAIRFDSIPNPTAAAIALPNRLDGTGRGLVRPMELKDTSLTVEEIIVTRRMLPAGNAAVRDITVKAHFRAERVMPSNDSNDRITNRLLRVHGNQGTLYRSDEINREDIAAMWVEVDYRGNSDVAIDWVQIGTENYTWLLEGWYDQQFRTTWQRIVDSLDTYNARRFGTADHADRLRLWRWFSRDEGPEMYWEGMGYFRDLLGPSLTEVGVTKRSRFSQQVYHHLTGSDENWDGATISPHLNVVAPYFTHGHDNIDSIKRLHLGHTWGRHSIASPSTDTVDYDLFWNGHTGSPAPPSPMKLPINDTSDPTGDVLRYPLGLRTGGGMQSHYELQNWLMKQTPWFMFWDKTPWLANLWIAPGIKSAAQRPSWAQLEFLGHAPRFVTGEEATLLAWSHIIRGAKGLVYWWGPNRDSAVSHGHAAVQGTFDMGLAYAPPREEIFHYVWNASENKFDETKTLRIPTQTLAQNVTLVNNRTAVLQDLAARSPAIGPDWLADDNSTGLWQAMSENTNPTFAQQLTNLHLGDTTRNQLYLGWLSLRSALQTVGETMTRCQDDVAELKLRGWHSRGFRTWSLSRSEADSIPVANASAFDGILAVTAFRTRHPHRDGPYDWPTWEPLDSSFIEASVLKIDTVPMSERYVVGILNRRVSPFDYERGANGSFGTDSTDSNHVNVDRFHTYEEWRLAVVADTLQGKPSRHRRMGSRQIDIPFRSGDPAGLLHVRELGGQADVAMGYVPIDTIVGALSGLRVNFLPGEGKLFEVRRLPGADTTGRGFMAFSSQTKLVAAPVLNAAKTAYTDSVRYHAVYHAPDTDTARTGVWTVFYQRSIPYLRDNMPRVAGLQWEPPIRLSRLTTLSHPLTDGQARTRLYGIDSSGYHDDIGAETSPERDCSCGFPSVVVAERAPLEPHVSVVYACEDMWASGEARNYLFHVVENAFDDEDTLNIAALDINGRSLVVARKNLVHGDSLKSLARHGVPVVGAAAEGRRFYAWSADAMGIGAAAKLAGSQWLAGPQSVTEIPRPTIRWYYNPADSMQWHDIEGGTARQPSLTAWSNVAHGNVDASLVWVESMTNPHVRYTRLAMGAGQAIERYLPTFHAMQYAPGAPPPVPEDRADDIAVVGAPAATEHAELPVVVRSLQPDSMFIHIRNAGDSVGRTYDYGHETVAWAEWVPSNGRARVRANHMMDVGGDSGRELHYWYVNTTFSNSSSLFHPVIANAVMRMDTLTWQGYIDDSLHTYMDSLRINYGNISDSALAINYNVLGAAGYQILRNRMLVGQGSYWMGLSHFTPLLSQLITVRRMPGIPAPPTTILHTNYLTGKGAWQHLSLRERDDRPAALQGVRRTAQTSADMPPYLQASAEGFYKPETGEDEPTAPATFRGFIIGDQDVAVRAVLSGRGELSLSVDKGRGGYLSAPMTLGAATTLLAEALGEQRESVELTIEEDGKPETAMAITLPGVAAKADVVSTTDDAVAEREVTGTLYHLVGGMGRTFRLRLRSTAGTIAAWHEATEIDPPVTDDSDAQARAALGTAHIIDLAARRNISVADETSLLVFPNPAAASVNIAIVGNAVATTYSVVDAAGRVVHAGTIMHGNIATIEGLPTGVYAVRAYNDVGKVNATVRQATFVVVR